MVGPKHHNEPGSRGFITPESRRPISAPTDYLLGSFSHDCHDTTAGHARQRRRDRESDVTIRGDVIRWKSWLALALAPFARPAWQDASNLPVTAWLQTRCSLPPAPSGIVVYCSLPALRRRGVPLMFFISKRSHWSDIYRLSSPGRRIGRHLGARDRARRGSTPFLIPLHF